MADLTSPSPPSSRRVAVVLVAAGRGARAMGPDGGDVPKQYRRIGGRPVITRTIEAFLRHPEVGSVTAVIHEDDRPLADAAFAEVEGERDRLRPPVGGGATRQISVRRGLESLEAEAPDLVLIHDAVRPFVTETTVDAAIRALVAHQAIVVGTPVVDTVKRADAAGAITDTVPRDGLWRAATPQGFRYATILEAHRRAAAAGRIDLTDDGAVAEWAGHTVHMVPCDEGNMKLTTVDDFDKAERRLTAEMFLKLPDVRVGVGYDIHSFEPGDAVVLGGVTIPHSAKLNGHSDSDVALHALTDAILGAIGDGDIGTHFPPSDGRWKGAKSEIFLADAVRRVHQRGGIIAHCDVTLIAEVPKIGPHRDAMRAEIARICGLSVDRVGLKATTNEKIGAVGRREGIASIATATIRLPMA